MLYIRNLKATFVTERNPGLGNFMRSQTSKLARNVEVSSVCRQGYGIEGRVVFT
jgi:hypothetical protein